MLQHCVHLSSPAGQCWELEGLEIGELDVCEDIGYGYCGTLGRPGVLEVDIAVEVGGWYLDR